MPLYEYYCKSCDWTFEALRSISQSAADATCPECGSTARKKLSVVARVGVGPSSEFGSLPMYGESAGGGGCACGGACSC